MQNNEILEKIPKRILIVEDELLLVEMYKEKFRREGFRVSTVMDGKKAMQRIKQGTDLILLDILMPGLNGFEILKKIKADQELRQIPVVVLTNIGSESVDKDKDMALSLGATDYLVKALNTPEQVLVKVRDILK